ncbi:hypothetical protein WAE61_11730 [Comamonadaceae bacterium PP-2]
MLPLRRKSGLDYGSEAGEWLVEEEVVARFAGQPPSSAMGDLDAAPPFWPLLRPSQVRTMKRIVYYGVFFVVAALVAGAAAFVTMAVKDQRYAPSAAFAPSGEPNRKVAVVYYSRSGHSEAVAREVARRFNAPIARITADYPQDFDGQGQAIADAKDKVLPAIAVEPIDLAPAERVYLVSPTWMFRPATPLWSYVERTDFAGKEVVLFTTGNSRFEPVEIDDFARRVEANGGRFDRHVFLQRGRIYWQMSREELLAATREALSASKTPR